MSQAETVETGQYWLFRGTVPLPSLWLIAAVVPDDRGESDWATVQCVFAGFGFLGRLAVEEVYTCPVEDFDNNMWTLIAEEDVPLYILGELG